MIPRMDDLVRVIDDFKDNTTKHPTVRSAAVRGLTILNKYYQRSDESFMYRIAMALDPRFKLQYFIDQEWPKDWIKIVKAIAHRIYKEDYANVVASDAPVSPRRHPAPIGAWPSLLRKSKAPAHQDHDELTTFWASPPECETDPLQFWSGCLVARPESCLAWMAIDYLSAPASSVEVEHAFSRGALTVTHRRHLLSHESTM